MIQSAGFSRTSRHGSILKLKPKKSPAEAGWKLPKADRHQLKLVATESRLKED
jgi:hypothetical protein